MDRMASRQSAASGRQGRSESARKCLERLNDRTLKPDVLLSEFLNVLPIPRIRVRKRPPAPTAHNRIAVSDQVIVRTLRTRHKLLVH